MSFTYTKAIYREHGSCPRYSGASGVALTASAFTVEAVAVTVRAAASPLTGTGAVAYGNV